MTKLKVNNKVFEMQVSAGPCVFDWNGRNVNLILQHPIFVDCGTPLDDTIYPIRYACMLMSNGDFNTLRRVFDQDCDSSVFHNITFIISSAAFARMCRNKSPFGDDDVIMAGTIPLQVYGLIRESKPCFKVVSCLVATSERPFCDDSSAHTLLRWTDPPMWTPSVSYEETGLRNIAHLKYLKLRHDMDRGSIAFISHDTYTDFAILETVYFREHCTLDTNAKTRINKALQYLHDACQINAFCAAASFDAIVFYQDVSKSPPIQITPAHMAKVLEGERGNAIVGALVESVTPSMRRHLSTWAYLYQKHASNLKKLKICNWSRGTDHCD